MTKQEIENKKTELRNKINEAKTRKFQKLKIQTMEQ